VVYYPSNGLRAGDFTGTLTADSYFIEDGKIKAPIKVNTLRINDNINNVLMGIRGLTSDTRPTLLWAADEIVYAPVGVMVEKVHFEQIAEPIYVLNLIALIIAIIFGLFVFRFI
jgi:hypothetical protein